LLANTEIFASLFLALVSSSSFKAKEEGAGVGCSSVARGRRGDLFRQPSGRDLGAMLAYLVYVWLIPDQHWECFAAGTGVVTGFVAVIGGLRGIPLEGNLHALSVAWAFGDFATSSLKQPSLCSETSRHGSSGCDARLGLLWYFGVRQIT